MRALFALLSLITTTAFAGEARFETTLPAVQRGFLHPTIAIGFDPQPEPPRWRTDLTTLQAPRITVIQAPAAQTSIRLRVTGGGAQVESLILPADACGTRTDTVLFPAGREVALPPGPCSQGRLTLEAVLSDGTVMRFALEITAEAAAWRGVSPGAIVGFNPQPDPPREAGMVLNLRFPVLVTTVHLALSGQDEAGNALSWR